MGCWELRVGSWELQIENLELLETLYGIPGIEDWKLGVETWELGVRGAVVNIALGTGPILKSISFALF